MYSALDLWVFNMEGTSIMAHTGNDFNTVCPQFSALKSILEVCGPVDPL